MNSMMKQTALQKLIEKWESEKGSYIPKAMMYQSFIDDAKSLLPIEREQIEEAWLTDRDHSIYSEGPQGAKEYYDETYGNESKSE